MPKQHPAIDVAALLFIGLAMFLTLPFHQGITIFDPAAYTIAAKQLALGKPVELNTFSIRFIAWLPYVPYIKLFGVNNSLTWITTAELATLLASTYLFLRRYDQTIALVSIILIGGTRLILYTSANIGGDILLACLLNISALMAWNAESIHEQRSLTRSGIIGGTVWILAFFTKESAVLFLPLFVYLTVDAWRKMKPTCHYWKTFWGILIFAGLATMVASKIVHDDFFWKIRSTEAAISLANDHYGTSTWIGLLKRFTFQPLQFIAEEPSLGILTVLAFAGIPSPQTRGSFWKKYLIFTLLAWIFMTQQLSTYSPLGLIPRLWIPLAAPLAIAAAHTCVRFMRREETAQERILLACTVGLACIVNGITWTRFVNNPADLYWIKVATASYIAAGSYMLLSRIHFRKPLPDPRTFVVCAALFFGMRGVVDEVVRTIKTPVPSTYQLAQQAMNKLSEFRPTTVFTGQAYVKNYEIYLDYLPLKPFQEFRGEASSYVLIDLPDLNYRLSNGQEAGIFSSAPQSVEMIERHPNVFGFKPVWKNERFIIYKN